MADFRLKSDILPGSAAGFEQHLASPAGLRPLKMSDFIAKSAILRSLSWNWDAPASEVIRRARYTMAELLMKYAITWSVRGLRPIEPTRRQLEFAELASRRQRMVGTSEPLPRE